MTDEAATDPATPERPQGVSEPSSASQSAPGAGTRGGGSADEGVGDDDRAPSQEPRAGHPDITTDGDLDEDLVEMVEVGVRLQEERDEYLDLARRVQAEFENYKRRVEVQRVEQRERAAEDLARELLPVLDAGEAALSQGHEDAAALHNQLMLTLEKHGLAKVDSAGAEFDPNVHEAVLHEDGEAGDVPVVEEILRTGYLWNSRVIRPAMVKVRG